MGADDHSTVRETSGDAGLGTAELAWQLPGGRYQVLGEIAHGGMGIVLRAHDAAFDRTLAIKLMRPKRAGSDESEWRFLEEAAITGQLQHPGIPPVHDVGRLADGRPYFCMKLIAGRTLAELLSARSEPQTDLSGFLKIFEQIAQTLAYAHSQGIIHRDLKPLNIMVGAFGEVQVMDWGLAKRLRHDGPAAASTASKVPSISPLSGLEETVAAESGTRDSQTEAGVVLGTLAYMAPEQARGDVVELDERCDVFGLGAILCVILTGQPPYIGDDRQAIWKLAREADLAGAWLRLDACGADVDLVTLTKSCLAEDKEDRPRQAGAVAEAIGSYLASLQARLHDARVAQAAAEVRAAEERKRRRLALGFAAMVLLLIAGTAIAGIWYVTDRGLRQAESLARREYLDREVSAALDEAAQTTAELHARLVDPEQAARLLSELDGWRESLGSAQERWNRADRLAAGDQQLLAPSLRLRLADLQSQLRQDERDRQVAFDLDAIRQHTLGIEDGEVELARAVPELERAFQQSGYDVLHGEPTEVAARMRASAVRPALVAGLDFWALVDRDPTSRTRVLEVARQVDPHPWRDRFRQTDVWGDAESLKSLAAEASLDEESPQLLAALAMRMRLMGRPTEAVALLRRGLLRHPRDFWLLSELGYSSHDLTEQEGAFRGAVGVRPDSAFAWYNLGYILYRREAWALAAECFQRAIAIDPTYVGAYVDLGLALDGLQRLEEAIEQFRRAIALEPDHALAHLNLGGALQGQGKWDEALSEYRRAMELKPDLSAAHNNVGAVLRDMGRTDDAIAAFRATVERFPEHAMAWCNLGHALNQQGRFGEALTAFETGHTAGSRQHDWTFPSAQWIEDTKRWIMLDEKLSAALRGDAAVTTADARERYDLANMCLMHRRRCALAAEWFALAFEADPELADDLAAGGRYNAACAAALASTGAGEDAASLPEEQRPALREQARNWLRADLGAWAAERAAQAPLAGKVVPTLRHWLVDPDLAGIRDSASLAALPEEERSAWQHFWSDVAMQLSAAESTIR